MTIRDVGEATKVVQTAICDEIRRVVIIENANISDDDTRVNRGEKRAIPYWTHGDYRARLLRQLR